ncbi:MAG: ROK family protein [Candidatus Pacearchaeota archaeon]|nr:MAG: ROK family protein [Candidatus Pacearchaeota archaeon]
MSYVIALDVGGTKIAGALIQNNKIIKKIKFSTKAKKGKKFVIKRIFSIISLLLEGLNKKNILGTALGMPGPLDSEKGIVFQPPNLPGWKNVPIKRIIEKKFKLKTRIENDTNCAALAESHFFHCENLICLSLGTGVGSGIIIDGKIYHGQGTAGELGHMAIDLNGPKCHCGNHGCLEEFVSARGIARVAKEESFKFSLEPQKLQYQLIKLQQQAKKGNKKSIALYSEVGKYLGVGLANIINIFNPEMIVINGGISKAGNLLLKPAIKEMKKRSFKVSQKGVKIVISKLQENAGLLGAASLI